MNPLKRYQKLHSAVVADVLDALDRRHQTMAPELVSLGAGQQVVGFAATLRVEAVDEVPSVPYTVQFAAVDQLRHGDIMVVAAPPNVASAFWGELISTRAAAAGCHGAVVDGFTRDIEAIRRQGFPVWARGTHPADSAGRLEAVEAGGRIRCGGVTVEPGDVLIADLDGVVVVPRGLADEVVERAEQKAATEDVVRKGLRAGRGVQELYDEHGVM
jgi:4-hydroxy-4-methyl-2-oxoglutarate aldolase